MKLKINHISGNGDAIILGGTVLEEGTDKPTYIAPIFVPVPKAQGLTYRLDQIVHVIVQAEID